MDSLSVPARPRPGCERRKDRHYLATAVEKCDVERKPHAVHVNRAAWSQQEPFATIWHWTTQHASQSGQPPIGKPDAAAQLMVSVCVDHPEPVHLELAEGPIDGEC